MLAARPGDHAPGAGLDWAVFRDDVDRLFADLFPGGRHGASNEARAPVDVYLTDGPPPSLTVELDIAGVDPTQVDVALVEDVLVVRGERRCAGPGGGPTSTPRSPGGPSSAASGWAWRSTRARPAPPYENGILRILPPLPRAAAHAPGGDHGSRHLMAEGDIEVEIAEVEGPPESEPEIPRELPVLALKETVVFPEAVAPLAIGEPRSVRLIDEVLNHPNRMLVLVASRDPEVAEPTPEQIHDVGTVALVQRMVRVPDGTVRILAQGLRRVRLGPYTQTEPFLVAHVEEVPDDAERTTEVEALARNLQAVFTRMIELVPHLPDELQVAVANIEDPTTLSYVIASSIRLSTPERQELLEETDLEARLRRLTVLCTRELELLELGAKIQSDVQLDMDKSQREFFLRQQLKAIREELGEGGDSGREIEELHERLVEVDPPEDVRTAAERELARLERLPAESAEHGVVRNYLDWILSLPWSVTTEDDLDLERARAILDEDHYDIEKVKDRIIEQLAVARLKSDAAGRSSASWGRRGWARPRSASRSRGRWDAASRASRWAGCATRRRSAATGAPTSARCPGTIVRAIRDAGAMNPVLMVDEIDKMGSDVRGDPSSAMLEVLDPAQNGTFRDHYLDLPLDLSRVLFLCTANVLETIPPALLDRMEVIRLSGYTEEEKLHIARRYLLPRQIAGAGCPRGCWRSPTRACGP